VADAGSIVYRDIFGRTRLLASVLRGEERPEPPVEESLAAYAEPSSLPEPLLRSKVG
jgi:hypothetical protein